MEFKKEKDPSTKAPQQQAKNSQSKGYLNRWLGGEEISKCFQVFETEGLVSDDVYILDPIYSTQIRLDLQLSMENLVFLPMANKRHIFLPVSNSNQHYTVLPNNKKLFLGDNGSHWSLLHLDRETSKFTYIDSLGSFNLKQGEALAKNLEEFLKVPTAKVYTSINDLMNLQPMPIEADSIPFHFFPNSPAALQYSKPKNNATRPIVACICLLTVTVFY